MAGACGPAIVDVLVMGAYGHSRWREFILRDATKGLLAKAAAPDPVFALTAAADERARRDHPAVATRA